VKFYRSVSLRHSYPWSVTYLFAQPCQKVRDYTSLLSGRAAMSRWKPATLVVTKTNTANNRTLVAGRDGSHSIEKRAASPHAIWEDVHPTDRVDRGRACT